MFIERAPKFFLARAPKVLKTAMEIALKTFDNLIKKTERLHVCLILH